LGQDYILKQLTASLIYPETDLGKTFWDRVYKKAQEVYGTAEIPINTFNKVWIMPATAAVYENGNQAFIVESRLKVMVEEDYLALREGTRDQRRETRASATTGEQSLKSQVSGLKSEEINELGTQIIKEVILPEIEREVNEGKNFAQLRQIYNSLILALWYKQALKEDILNRVYADQNKVKGVDLADKTAKEKIYQQYLAAFKQGVYDYIKEDYNEARRQLVPRKYFSGGFGVEKDFKVDRRATASATELSTEGSAVRINGEYGRIGEKEPDPDIRAAQSGSRPNESERRDRAMLDGRDRSGYGFFSGRLSKQEVAYQADLEVMFGQAGFDGSEEQKRDLVNALLRIKEGALTQRRELIPADEARLIFDQQQLELKGLFGRIKAEEDKYKSVRDEKGRLVFTARDIEELLYKKLIPFSWVKTLRDEGLNKSIIIRILTRYSDPMGAWQKELKAIFFQLTASGLTPTDAGRTLTRWSDPQGTWKVLKPIIDDLGETSQIKRLVLNWANPKERLEAIDEVVVNIHGYLGMPSLTARRYLIEHKYSAVAEALKEKGVKEAEITRLLAPLREYANGNGETNETGDRAMLGRQQLLDALRTSPVLESFVTEDDIRDAMSSMSYVNESPELSNIYVDPDNPRIFYKISKHGVEEGVGIEEDAVYFEAQNLAQINRDAPELNIPKLLAVGVTAGGHIWTMMDMMPYARSLDDELLATIRSTEDEPMSPPILIPDLIEVFVNIATTLQRLHQGGWIHDDMHPMNILVNKAGEVQLIDFGQAVRAGEITRGTHPKYQPPEGRTSAAYDVYSFGKTLENVFEEFYLLMPGRLSQADYVASGLKDLVAEMTKSERDQRVQSMGEIVARLGRVKEYFVQQEQSDRAMFGSRYSENEMWAEYARERALRDGEKYIPIIRENLERLTEISKAREQLNAIKREIARGAASYNGQLGNVPDNIGEMMRYLLGNAVDAIIVRVIQANEPNYVGRFSWSLGGSEEGDLTLTIEDNGIGIDKDTLSAFLEYQYAGGEKFTIRTVAEHMGVYERFFYVRGNGVGLTKTKELLEQSGREVSFAIATIGPDQVPLQRREGDISIPRRNRQGTTIVLDLDRSGSTMRLPRKIIAQGRWEEPSSARAMLGDFRGEDLIYEPRATLQNQGKLYFEDEGRRVELGWLGGMRNNEVFDNGATVLRLMRDMREFLVYWEENEGISNAEWWSMIQRLGEEPLRVVPRVVRRGKVKSGYTFLETERIVGQDIASLNRPLSVEETNYFLNLLNIMFEHRISMLDFTPNNFIIGHKVGEGKSATKAYAVDIDYVGFSEMSPQEIAREYVRAYRDWGWEKHDPEGVILAALQKVAGNFDPDDWEPPIPVQGMESKELGGIDLNPKAVELDVRKGSERQPVIMNPSLDQLENIQLEGLYPIIINITPVTNLPLLFGAQTQETGEPYARAGEDRALWAVSDEKQVVLSTR